ncbi:Putative zn(2)-C6 fungal-type DNA-binding domain, fungal transcription factor [Septoria linicola]|uniref:Zn(2)-C6 fungal-type DNA-binding domain, fungal transcription factor n=1 Tax=Septoria linicola TaxID=215465 RepID=A0A9Q9AUP5_9PEZI|nr:putative zn(2)-C6 fungal-type DNA-binding domain, fungal transcription factor [Septoria linicola]USW51041.1 Putative zn(2)-C6 fungal-type DNA-binding domain, fungal transcription factor [Septoria linicola]
MSTTARRARVVEGSCWTCKNRRVKCDLAKPTCGRCQKNEQECGYGQVPFRWVGGQALRGRHAPSSRSEDLGSLKVQSVGPDQPARRAFEPSRRNLGPLKAVKAQEEVSNAVLPLALTSSIGQDTLVPYFINIVLPRYCLRDFVISLDHDLLLKDEALREATLAISRAHFDMQAKNGSALARNRSRQTAIATFRRQLASNAVAESAAQNLFSTNVLFCLLDGMIEPTEETNASTLHLKGGFAILDRWNNIVPDIIAAGGIRTHLLSVFTTLDLVHAILSGRNPHFEPTIYRQLANVQAWWGRLDPDDAIISASENLCRLAALGSMVRTSLDMFGREATQQRVFYFESMLSSPIRAHFRQTDCLSEHNSTRMDDWTAFCTLYDISARIFYERAIRLKSVDDGIVQLYTKQAARMLKQDLFSGMLQHCIVLPLVIIGAHCLDDHDQDAICRALAPTLSYLSFGCLLVMEQFLKATWKKRDLDVTWWESFEDIAEKIFLF